MADTSPAATTPNAPPSNDVRERILETASALFYAHGVRAIGVDLVVEKAGVAKTSLYRHFRTKDDLIAAFLDREDADFWRTWDEAAAPHGNDPEAELAAHLAWIGARTSRQGYRGCPQINTAAEFPEEGHPARAVATRHMAELHRRLEALAGRLSARDPGALATQLAVLINGAFASSALLADRDGAASLAKAAAALVQSSRA